MKTGAGRRSIPRSRSPLSRGSRRWDGNMSTRQRSDVRRVGAGRLPQVREDDWSGSSVRCWWRRVVISAGQRVLDVAAGTGNVAIRAAETGRPASWRRTSRRRTSRRVAAKPAHETSSWSGWRPTRRPCPLPMTSSTSSPPRSARCSRRTTRRWPTSSCACAGREARSEWLNFTPEGLAADFFGVVRAATCRHLRRRRCRRSSGGARSTYGSCSATGWSTSS